MKTFPLDALGLQQMASGHVCLNLSTKVGWEDFPAFAEDILEECKGTVIEKADAVDIRMWRVKIEESEVRLVFDDYPAMVSMESSDDAGDLTLKHLSKILSPSLRR
mgnify:CR=1 FL=1